MYHMEVSSVLAFSLGLKYVHSGLVLGWEKGAHSGSVGGGGGFFQRKINFKHLICNNILALWIYLVTYHRKAIKTVDQKESF